MIAFLIANIDYIIIGSLSVMGWIARGITVNIKENRSIASRYGGAIFIAMPFGLLTSATLKDCEVFKDVDSMRYTSVYIIVIMSQGIVSYFVNTPVSAQIADAVKLYNISREFIASLVSKK